jgi:hypothetical protein
VERWRPQPDQNQPEQTKHGAIIKRARQLTARIASISGRQVGKPIILLIKPTPNPHRRAGFKFTFLTGQAPFSLM